MRSNEDKLDLFADLLEPAGRILSDKGWARKWQAGDKFGAIKSAIKDHKPEIVEILARVEGVEPEDYVIDGMALLLKVAELMNRPDLEQMADLFTSQVRSATAASSGPATGTMAAAAQ